METRFDSSEILSALRGAPNDILTKRNLVKKCAQTMIEDGIGEKDRASVICKIIEAGNYVTNVNAMAVAGLAKFASLTGEGVSIICQNLYKNHPDRKQRFIKNCKIEGVLGMEKVDAAGNYNDNSMSPSTAFVVRDRDVLSVDGGIVGR